MRKKILAIFFLSIINLIAYSQSYNQDKYINQMIGKLNKLTSDLNRSSQFAMRASNKDIYVLYCNGKKVACFSDEWSCKAHINSIKLQMENITESVLNGMPREIQPSKSQLRNTMKGYINQMNFSYRKEANPNYRTSGLSDKNNGFEENDFQGLNNFFQNINQKDNEELYNIPESIFSSTNRKKEENNNLETILATTNNLNNEKTLEELLSIDTSNKNVIGLSHSTTVTTHDAPNLNDYKYSDSGKDVSGGPNTNIFRMDELARNPYYDEKNNNEIKDVLYKSLLEERRRKDLEWYEENTPWYDKKIDKYNTKLQYEDLNVLEAGDILIAHSAKEVVNLWDNAGNFIIDNVPKLINGQAEKELTVAASSLLDFASKGNLGKTEVDAGKEYYSAINNSFELLSSDGTKEIVGAIGDEHKSKEVSSKFDQNVEQYKEAANNYSESKIGMPIIPPTNIKEISNLTTNKIIGGINTVRNEKIKKTIRNTPNGELKQGVSYVNGFFSKYNGSLLEWSFRVKK